MGDTTTQSNGFITVADNSIHVMHVTHAVDHDSDRTIHRVAFAHMGMDSDLRSPVAPAPHWLLHCEQSMP